MKELALKFLKPGTLGRWLAIGFYHHPIRFFIALCRSLIATKKMTGSFYPIRVRIGTGQMLIINETKNSKISISGNLLVNSWGGNSQPSSISCSQGSSLTISGDFEIGPNVHLTLAKNATLVVGGKRKSSASGITCDSRIMVENSLSIGVDTIIAWGVYISDSNWHEVSGATRSSPVFIGDHVWISHDVSVLKGSVIPSGCIVGAKSLVGNVFHTEKALIAGVPAKILKNNVEWTR